MVDSVEATAPMEICVTAFARESQKRSVNVSVIGSVTGLKIDAISAERNRKAERGNSNRRT